MARRIAATLAAGAVAAAIAPAAAADLVPHRAEYTLSLASTASGSGVTGAEGRMVYRLARTCDGWRVENRSALDLVLRDQGTVQSHWSYAATRRGDRLRFHVRNKRNGRVTDARSGTARFTGKGGTAHYTRPDEKTVSLPEGTMGPVAHTAAVLEAARRGETVFSRPVFDGADKPGAYHVNAVIGRKIAASEAGDLEKDASPLLDSPSWRVHLAFYPDASTDAKPAYEVGMRLHANGVGQQVTQDYGDFAVRAQLTDVKRLPEPECAE